MLKIWGGMAFHGALLGVAIAVLIMAKRHRCRFCCGGIALVVPIGLFFGRCQGNGAALPWAWYFQ